MADEASASTPEEAKTPDSQPGEQAGAPTNDNQQGQEQQAPQGQQQPSAPSDQTDDGSNLLTDEEAGNAPEAGTEQTPQGKDGKPTEPEKPEAAKDPEQEAKKQEARERYLERQLGKRDEVIDALTEQLQEGYVNQGDDDNEKRLRGLETREFVTQIQTARSSLVTDNQKVQSEIDVFNPSSPKYVGDDKRDLALAQYARQNVILQPIQLPDGTVSNEVVGYRQPLYGFMQEMADLIGAETSSGPTQAQQQQQQTEQAQANMEAAAVTPGSASPGKGEPEDPFAKGMDSIE